MNAPLSGPARRRVLSLVLVGAMAVAGTAFVVDVFYGDDPGLSTPPPLSVRQHHAAGLQRTDLPADSIPVARSYAELASRELSPNRRLATRLPAGATGNRDRDQLQGSIPYDPMRRAEVVSERAALRAYDGAPPVVPHRIDQRDAQACLVCHGEGMRVGQVRAPRMSHELMANCTQCHVESTNRALPSPDPDALFSYFEGLRAGRGGVRAWAGAPPTIPHSTWMREDCLACHGPTSAEGLQSSHPWRSSCTQCHAPSADREQLQVRPADRPPVAPQPDAVRGER